MSKLNGLLILIVLAAASCGIPKGKTLSELNSDEREAICEDVSKEDAMCEGYGSVTRNKTECETIVASVNSACDVTVEEYRDALEAPVCSMLEELETWESCFGDPEDDEPIIINTNNSSSGNNQDSSGPSGSGSGRLVVDLSFSETESLCEELTDPRTVECDDGTEWTSATAAECVQLVDEVDPNCNATVTQLEACIGAPLCDISATLSACEPLTDCSN